MRRNMKCGETENTTKAKVYFSLLVSTLKSNPQISYVKNQVHDL